MSGAELSQGSNAPDGFRYETLAPGTTGELQILVPDLGEPEPGIIDLAPENPVALHIVPRQTPEEMGDWFGLKAIAQRTADRRLSDNAEHAPHKQPSEDEPTLFRVELDKEVVRDISEERRQAILAQKRLEGLRQLIFAKGIGVQATPQERTEADAVLSWHSKTIHPNNKRSY